MMRFNRLNIVAALLACWLCVPVARAATVESRVDVLSRSDSERARGAIRGLFELLQERYPPDHPLTVAQRRDLSGEANDFVQRYGYLTDPDGSIVLRLQFDQKAIEARVESILNDATDDAGGLEPALLWLIVTQGPTELMLTAGAQGVLPDTLDQVATALAQPLVYPRDGVLSDGTVTGDDIRDVNVTRLETASIGYAAGQTLVLSMVTEGDDWLGNWTLLSTGEQWTSTGPLATMLQVGLTAYQGRVAALEQASDTPRAFGSKPGDITVSVAGVNVAADYAWLSVNLRDRLPGMTVKAVSVSQGEVVYVIGGGAGDQGRVAQSIASLGPLQLVLPTVAGSVVTDPTPGVAGDGDAVAPAPAADLNYLLVR